MYWPARLRGWLEEVREDTNVVSTARCALPHHGSPLCITSIRLSSCRSMCSKLRSLSRVLVVTLANKFVRLSKIFLYATSVLGATTYFVYKIYPPVKQRVPPKKELYKMKTLGGHPTTKSERRQTYVGTNFKKYQEIPVYRIRTWRFVNLHVFHVFHIWLKNAYRCEVVVIL